MQQAVIAAAREPARLLAKVGGGAERGGGGAEPAEGSIRREGGKLLKGAVLQQVIGGSAVGLRLELEAVDPDRAAVTDDGGAVAARRKLRADAQAEPAVAGSGRHVVHRAAGGDRRAGGVLKLKADVSGGGDAHIGREGIAARRERDGLIHRAARPEGRAARAGALRGARRADPAVRPVLGAAVLQQVHALLPRAGTGQQAVVPAAHAAVFRILRRADAENARLGLVGGIGADGAPRAVEELVEIGLFVEVVGIAAVGRAELRLFIGAGLAAVFALRADDVGLQAAHVAVVAVGIFYAALALGVVNAAEKTHKVGDDLLAVFVERAALQIGILRLCPVGEGDLREAAVCGIGERNAVFCPVAGEVALADHAGQAVAGIAQQNELLGVDADVLAPDRGEAVAAGGDAAARVPRRAVIAIVQGVSVGVQLADKVAAGEDLAVAVVVGHGRAADGEAEAVLVAVDAAAVGQVVLGAVGIVVDKLIADGQEALLRRELPARAEHHRAVVGDVKRSGSGGVRAVAVGAVIDQRKGEGHRLAVGGGDGHKQRVLQRIVAQVADARAADALGLIGILRLDARYVAVDHGEARLVAALARAVEDRAVVGALVRRAQEEAEVIIRGGIPAVSQRRNVPRGIVAVAAGGDMRAIHGDGGRDVGGRLVPCQRLRPRLPFVGGREAVHVRYAVDPVKVDVKVRTGSRVLIEAELRIGQLAACGQRGQPVQAHVGARQAGGRAVVADVKPRLLPRRLRGRACADEGGADVGRSGEHLRHGRVEGDGECGGIDPRGVSRDGEQPAARDLRKRVGGGIGARALRVDEVGRGDLVDRLAVVRGEGDAAVVAQMRRQADQLHAKAVAVARARPRNDDALLEGVGIVFIAQARAVEHVVVLQRGIEVLRLDGGEEAVRLLRLR